MPRQPQKKTSKPANTKATAADPFEFPIQFGKPRADAAGAAVVEMAAKYGIHSLRHACASLWIEQGMNPKRIQTLMGHSTIQMTFDIYGHLFKDVDADQLAAEQVQARLLGS